MYLLVMSAEPVSVLYESACQNYPLLLLQTNYVPAWAGLEPVHVSLDLVVYPIRIRKFKSGKSYEILNTCDPTYVKQTDVGAMFPFFPSYAYLHKSKMAAVSHIEFLTFNRIALESHVIHHFCLT